MIVRQDICVMVSYRPFTSVLTDKHSCNSKRKDQLTAAWCRNIVLVYIVFCFFWCVWGGGGGGLGFRVRRQAQARPEFGTFESKNWYGNYYTIFSVVIVFLFIFLRCRFSLVSFGSRWTVVSQTWPNPSHTR